MIREVSVVMTAVSRVNSTENGLSLRVYGTLLPWRYIVDIAEAAACRVRARVRGASEVVGGAFGLEDSEAGIDFCGPDAGYVGATEQEGD